MNQNKNCYFIETTGLMFFEEINVCGRETSGYIIYQLGLFLDVNFKNEPKVYKNCHALIFKIMSFNKIIIVSVNSIKSKTSYFRVPKDEASNSLKNTNLTELR